MKLVETKYICALIFCLSLTAGLSLIGCENGGSVTPSSISAAEPEDAPDNTPEDGAEDAPDYTPGGENEYGPDNKPDYTPADGSDINTVVFDGFSYDPKTGETSFNNNSWLAKLGYTAEFDSTNNRFNLFKNGKRITKITVPEIFEYQDTYYRVASIGESAFLHCAVNTVNIPNSVVYIGEKAFYGCSILTKITIPDSVTAIGDEAFNYCTSLHRIEFSKNLSSIGKQAFAHIDGFIGDLKLPESLKRIDEKAFYCSHFSSVILPDSLEYLGKDALSCDGLGEVVWKGDKYTDIDEFNKAIKAAGIATEDVWIF